MEKPAHRTPFFFHVCLPIHAGISVGAVDVLVNVLQDRPSLDNLRFVIPPAWSAGLFGLSLMALAIGFIRWISPCPPELRRRAYLAAYGTVFAYAAALQLLESHAAYGTRVPAILTFATLGSAAALHFRTSQLLGRGGEVSAARILLLSGLYISGALNLAVLFYIPRIEEIVGLENSYRLENAVHLLGSVVLGITFSRALTLQNYPKVTSRLMVSAGKSSFVVFPFVLLAIGFELWAGDHGGRFHLRGSSHAPVWAWGGVALLTIAFSWRYRLSSSIIFSTVAGCLVIALPQIVGLWEHHVAHRSTKADIPRIILITADALRSDVLGCYGATRASTPFLDALADESVVFEDCSSTAPWTLPSFAAMFTGLPPLVFGTLTTRSQIPNRATFLAERLSAEGYFTGAVGLNHLLTHFFGFHQGFADYEFYPRKRQSRTLGSKLLSHVSPGFFLKEPETSELQKRAAHWLSKNRHNSFLFWLHFFDPHAPYEPDDEFRLEGDPPKGLRTAWNFEDQNKWKAGYLKLDDDERRDWIRSLYLGEVQEMDASLGKTIQHLKDLGLYDTSLIIFTSDHGEEFWEHGMLGHSSSLYREQIGVPLIVKLPGGKITGRVSQPVSTISLTPTILELIGIDFDPEDFGGPSLAPLLREHQEPVKTRPLFSVNPLRIGGEYAQSVRFDTFKLIHGIGDHRELYDLRSDPGEEHDLAEKLPDIVDRGLELLSIDRTRREALRQKHQITPAESIELEADTIEDLRRLGYL